MAPRIVPEGLEDSLDPHPASVRPVYLHWSPIFAGAIVAAPSPLSYSRSDRVSVWRSPRRHRAGGIHPQYWPCLGDCGCR